MIQDVHNKIDWDYAGEDDLTNNMMHRAVDCLLYTSPSPRDR